MKKKEIVTKEEIVEVSYEDIVKDFMNNEFDLYEWTDEDYYPTIGDYEFFWDDYSELTEEDKDKIWSLIKEKAMAEIDDAKEEERLQLINRTRIIDFFNELIDRSELGRGEVGFLLSTEEILDLILENGRK